VEKTFSETVFADFETWLQERRGQMVVYLTTPVAAQNLLYSGE
jgi:hypothetical protein